MSLVTEEPATRPARGALGPALRRVAVVLGVFVVVGALAGVVWEWLWTAPVGVAVKGEWVAESFDTFRGEFSGTAWYVVIASVAGLVTAVALALVLDRAELLTLAAVLAGSALAAWVMLLVGEALGPPDPQTVAATADDLTRIPDQLTVSGRSPFVAFPSGALVGLLVVFFGVTRLHRNDD